MIRHLAPGIQLPDGRTTGDIEDEAEALRVVAGLEVDLVALKDRLTQLVERQKTGEPVSLRQQKNARIAVCRMKVIITAIHRALRVARREEHQRREEMRLLRPPEPQDERLERIRAANAQNDTDIAAFLNLVRERFGADAYRALWAEAKSITRGGGIAGLAASIASTEGG